MILRNLGGLILVGVLSCIAWNANGAEEKEVELKLADCPAAVQKTLTREAHGAKIKEVEKETEDGETVYEAEVKIDGKEYEIEVAQDGTLLEKVLDEDEDDEDEDEEEEEVKLSDCPAAVQKTLKREAHGAKIKEVEKETEDGKAIYEAEVKIDGKEYEIEVAQDGTLICKSLDEDDDEEEEEDDE